MLDRRVDKNANTGLFELAYRQAPVPVPSYVGVSLVIEGQVMKKPSGEGGAGRKTTNDGAGLHSSRDGNSSQNKVRCVNGAEEPGFSTHKIKSVDAGTVGTNRTVLNRSSQTKSVNGIGNSVSEGRTRQKLAYAVATDSALSAAHEKPDGVRAAEGVRNHRTELQQKQQKCTTTSVVRIQRVARTGDPSCRPESSDSDSEPGRSWFRPKTVKTPAVGVKSSSGTIAADRRRSNVLAAESAVRMPTIAMTISGGKRRKATRPGAAKPRRHRRSKPIRRRHVASDQDSESAPSDYGHDPSTPPPADSSLAVADRRASTSTTTEPAPGFGRGLRRRPSASKPARTKPVVTTCSVIFAAAAPTPESASRQTRRRGTPSFHDLTRSQLTSNSTVTPSASVAVPRSLLFNADVSTPRWHARAGPPVLPADTFRSSVLPPNAPSFPARQIGTVRHIVQPIDWLRFSHCTAGSLRFTYPASRSMVMRGRDLTDLQASMQVIGLGNAA